MPKDPNSLRTWPAQHPSRAHVKSCIEFSRLPSSSPLPTASTSTGISALSTVSSSCAAPESSDTEGGTLNVPPPPESSDQKLKESFPNLITTGTSTSFDGGTNSSGSTGLVRRIPQASASSHDIANSSSSTRRHSYQNLKRTSFSLPRHIQPPVPQRAISVSSSNPFLDVNIIDFDLNDENEEDNDDESGEVNTPSGHSMAASCDDSCASGMSSNIEADSLENLLIHQDQDFQDLLEEFGEQQYELEKRKPPCPSHTSLSLTSLVSGDGDTSESSCGTLSEVFDSLSRFSQHCLVSMEEALTISSPMYHHHNQSSSFTTTPTADRGDFEFSFDYDPPPSSTSTLGAVGVSSASQSQHHSTGPALTEQVIYENQEAIERQRERDLMHVIPRRRLSSFLDGSRHSESEGVVSSSTSGAVTGVGSQSASDQSHHLEGHVAHLHDYNNDLRAQRVRDWSTYGTSTNSSSGFASCGVPGCGCVTGGGQSNATSIDSPSGVGLGLPCHPRPQHHGPGKCSGNKKHASRTTTSVARTDDGQTVKSWSIMTTTPTAPAESGGGADSAEGNVVKDSGESTNANSRSKCNSSKEGNEKSDTDGGIESRYTTIGGSEDGGGDSCHPSENFPPIDIGFDFDLFVSGLFRNASTDTAPVAPVGGDGGIENSPSSASCLFAAATSVGRENSPSSILGTIENSLLLQAAAAASGVSVVEGESGQVLVTPMDWQDRCMELQTTLQRFGIQATRVRLLLRDKVRNLLFSLFFFPLVSPPFGLYFISS